MKRYITCLLVFMLFAVNTRAQTKKDSANLRGAIDSIRDGRNSNPKGNSDTAGQITDTLNVNPEVPTPSSPNNPNPHDPNPTPVHPNPPRSAPRATNPNEGRPVSPGTSVKH